MSVQTPMKLGGHPRRSLSWGAEKSREDDSEAAQGEQCHPSLVVILLVRLVSALRDWQPSCGGSMHQRRVLVTAVSVSSQSRLKPYECNGGRGWRASKLTSFQCFHRVEAHESRVDPWRPQTLFFSITRHMSEVKRPSASLKGSRPSPT